MAFTEYGPNDLNNLIKDIKKGVSEGGNFFRFKLIDKSISECAYLILDNFQRILRINMDGTLSLDMNSEKIGDKTHKKFDGLTFENAREFHSIMFHNMIFSIVHNFGGYAIKLSEPIVNIMKYYDWYNFKSEFEYRGYILDVDKMEIRLELVDRNGHPNVNTKLYNKYCERFKGLEIHDDGYGSVVLDVSVDILCFLLDLSGSVKYSVGDNKVTIYNSPLMYWITGDFVNLKRVHNETIIKFKY